MFKFVLFAGGLSLLFAGLIKQPVAAAKQTANSKTPIGYDVSWPQCGKTLPNDHAFAVVGINGGLANNDNECLATQLAWAKRAIGGTKQPLVQLYVNTANPGGMNTPSWPKTNVDSIGNTPANPFGTCDGSDSLACAWMYGWNRAAEDAQWRFKPAATTANLSTTNPGNYMWWLDVETENTWKSPTSTFNYESNVAVLEGMASYFSSIGAKVGLYSTAVQWREITDNRIANTSPLMGLDNWRPSGTSLSTAKSNCTLAPFTPGGRISMTQFISRSLDNNYSCL